MEKISTKVLVTMIKNIAGSHMIIDSNGAEFFDEDNVIDFIKAFNEQYKNGYMIDGDIYNKLIKEINETAEFYRINFFLPYYKKENTYCIAFGNEEAVKACIEQYGWGTWNYMGNGKEIIISQIGDKRFLIDGKYIKTWDTNNVEEVAYDYLESPKEMVGHMVNSIKELD